MKICTRCIYDDVRVQRISFDENGVQYIFYPKK